MGDPVLAAAPGFFRHDLLRLALGADEEHFGADTAETVGVGERPLQHAHRLLEVDDVDAVALAEDIPPHLRVPAAGLVSEVDPRFE